MKEDHFDMAVIANLRGLYETLLGDVKADRVEFSLLEDEVNRIKGWVTTKDSEILGLNKALEAALKCIAALDRKVEALRNVQEVPAEDIEGKMLRMLDAHEVKFFDQITALNRKVEVLQNLQDVLVKVLAGKQ